jgi:hypothetical protein
MPRHRFADRHPHAAPGRAAPSAPHSRKRAVLIRLAVVLGLVGLVSAATETGKKCSS